MLTHACRLPWKPQSSCLKCCHVLQTLEKISRGPNHRLEDMDPTHCQPLSPQGETHPGTAACQRQRQSPIPDTISPASPAVAGQNRRENEAGPSFRKPFFIVSAPAPPQTLGLGFLAVSPGSQTACSFLPTPKDPFPTGTLCFVASGIAAVPVCPRRRMPMGRWNYMLTLLSSRQRVSTGVKLSGCTGKLLPCR